MSLAALTAHGRRASVPARATLALPAAGLLSLLIASQAMAASWGPPIPLSMQGNVRETDLVTLGASTAVAVYVETDDSTGTDSLFARRSITSGTTWLAPTLITSHGVFPAVAGVGSDVDVVWRAGNGRLRYARSQDGGVSFGPSVPLSQSGRFVWDPAVARGPGGLVVVAWEDSGNGDINVRVSHDGGTTFDPRRLLSSAGEESGTEVAIGDGVIYVAYSVGFENLRVRRSLNDGATWSSAAVVTNQAFFGDMSMTAVGSRAYIAYTEDSSFPNFFRVRYRRTIDSGANWSSQMDLSPASWTSSEPDIHLKGGVLRAVFTRCTPEIDICVDERTFYSQSSNGTGWTTPERVSPQNLFAAFRPRVGRSNKTIALYIGYDDSGLNPFARVRNP